MSPSPELNEQLNLILTLVTLGFFGAVLSLTYVVERSGVQALRWLLYIVLAGILAWTAGIGLVLSSSRAFVDEEALAAAFDAAFPTVEADAASGADVGPAAAPRGDAPSAEPGRSSVSDDRAAALVAIGNWALGLALLGLLLLLPWTRRFLARLIPIDPQRPVHLVALEYALLLVFVSAATGIFVELALRDPSGSTLEGLGSATSLTALWAQAGGFVLIAVFGVGLGVARSGRETLERLGLTQRFRPRWWLGMTLAGLAAGFAIDQLWSLASPIPAKTLAALGRSTVACAGCIVLAAVAISLRMYL